VSVYPRNVPPNPPEGTSPALVPTRAGFSAAGVERGKSKSTTSVGHAAQLGDVGKK
jgi:hypothetical protein